MSKKSHTIIWELFRNGHQECLFLTEFDCIAHILNEATCPYEFKTLELHKHYLYGPYEFNERVVTHFEEHIRKTDGSRDMLAELNADLKQVREPSVPKEYNPWLSERKSY